MKHFACKNVLLLISLLILSVACTQNKSKEKKVRDNETEQKSELVPGEIPWSQRMGETVLRLYPDIWSIRDRVEPKWQYDVALVLGSMIDLADETGDKKYYNYAKKYPDTFIDEKGQIGFNYKLSDYNIDHINSGKMLFRFYEDTKDERYKIALDTLMKQLEFHPRTKEGSFWHKKRYTHQVWLDGLYMGQPFYAEYALRFNEPEVFDDVVRQVLYIEEKTRDAETGLLYHGWDESMEQDWANKETGLSKNFWSRAVGWYAMAVVDVLDFLPSDHPGQKDVIAVLERLAEAISKVQDEKTGLWYQVLDQGDREGNYLESTGSSMFAYSFLKAARLGYIDERYGDMAEKGYAGIINNLIRVEEDGSVYITQACGGAGLSADRDGTYDYYINETIRENDPKAIGPFILASLEHESLGSHALRH